MAEHKRRNLKKEKLKAAVRLGFDIDAIASLASLGRQEQLDILSASSIARRAGADSIVAHVVSKPIEENLSKLCKTKGETWLKITHDSDVLKAALQSSPSAICFVSRIDGRPGPVKIAENIIKALGKAVADVKKTGISVGISINPEAVSLRQARSLGVDFVEICAAEYSHAANKKNAEEELEQLQLAVYLAYELDLKAWVGCGLNFENVRAVSQIPHLSGVNVGFSIIAHSLFWGLKSAIGEMKILIS